MQGPSHRFVVIISDPSDVSERLPSTVDNPAAVREISGSLDRIPRQLQISRAKSAGTFQRGVGMSLAP